VAETRAPPPLPSREADPIGHVAALHAHPRWMVERWGKWLSLEVAEQLCAANQVQAQAAIRVLRREGARAAALAALGRAGIAPAPGRYSPDALSLGPGAPPALDLEGHEEGFFQAQDEAAQLVSL
jgi:16S rRNA (cytosine967-C5)-methyltransferase